MSSWFFDPSGKLDPAFPPELKAVSAAQPLERNGDSVPADKLRAIQACFVAPPLRHQLSHAEQASHQHKAVELCRKAIAEHPDAPDLWIVRNRLIVSLMGLWKTDSDLVHLQEAFAEAEAAIEAGYPAGCDLVARFCLARQALRSPDADPATTIDGFIQEAGDKVSGPALAAACMLALDVADRVRFEQFRARILAQHTEDSMMWLATAFLLDRYHQYWMFQVPYTFGWIYHRREGHFLTDGDDEQANRVLKAELRDADGEPFRIPEDLTADYTAILLAPPPPWNSKRGDGLPRSPARSILDASPFAASRPDKDVRICLAVLGDEPYDGEIRDRKKNAVPCTMLTVPDGLSNPLVHRLGMPTLNKGINGVLLDKDGRILIMSSGLSPESTRVGNTLGEVIRNGVARQDELKIQSLIDKGEVELARKTILALAPHQDPDAVDEKGRKIKHPEQNLAHLRSRAKVYLALEEWDKALADATLILQRRTKMDADMSRRSDQLSKDEAFLDQVKARISQQ